MLDVRCINETNHSVRIPSLEEYEVMSWAPNRKDGGEATNRGVILDHPVPDRRIAAHEVIRKRIAVILDAKAGDVVELYCEFKGEKSTLKSNTIVLKRE